MINHLEGLINDFNELKTDKERFRFIIEHKGVFTLMLDNDQTIPIVSAHVFYQLSQQDFEALPELNEFDGYLGLFKGTFDLLDAIGVNCEPV